MSLQKIPHDTTKYRNNPIELLNISNRNRIGIASDYAVTANTKLLINGTGENNSTNITDVTGKTVTRYGDTKISTAQSIIGGSSIYFDGTGDYLSLADSADFDILTNTAYTIDFWMYPNDLTSPQFLIEASSGDATNRWVIILDTSGLFGTSNIMIGHFNSGIVGTPKTNLTISAWNHVAFVRETNNNWTVYINGVSKATASYSTSIAPSANMCIGAYNNGNAYFFNGYFSHLRITQGQALWTSNFTPPKYSSHNYIGI